MGSSKQPRDVSTILLDRGFDLALGSLNVALNAWDRARTSWPWRLVKVAFGRKR